MAYDVTFVQYNSRYGIISVNTPGLAPNNNSVNCELLKVNLDTLNIEASLRLGVSSNDDDQVTQCLDLNKVIGSSDILVSGLTAKNSFIPNTPSINNYGFAARINTSDFTVTWATACQVDSTASYSIVNDGEYGQFTCHRSANVADNIVFNKVDLATGSVVQKKYTANSVINSHGTQYVHNTYFRDGKIYNFMYTGNAGSPTVRTTVDGVPYYGGLGNGIFYFLTDIDGTIL